MDREKLRQNTCCFTGHRVIPENDRVLVEMRAEKKIRELHTQAGVRFFGCGGALGWDTMMASLLFRLRSEDLPDIKVILVYPFDGYTSRWTPAQQSAYQEMLPKYDKVVRVSTTASREAYLARNRHLVDGSAFCIAYQTRMTGGTAYTVRYAAQRGIVVYNAAQEV